MYFNILRKYNSKPARLESQKLNKWSENGAKCIKHSLFTLLTLTWILFSKCFLHVNSQYKCIIKSETFQINQTGNIIYFFHYLNSDTSRNIKNFKRVSMTVWDSTTYKIFSAYRRHILRRKLVGGVRDEQTSLTNCTIPHHYTLYSLHYEMLFVLCQYL